MCEKGSQLFPRHNCSDCPCSWCSPQENNNRGLSTILHSKGSSGDCIPLLQYKYCIVTSACNTSNNMPDPFLDGGASKAARNRRPLPALSSSSGEELGLVPSKYLKRGSLQIFETLLFRRCCCCGSQQQLPTVPKIIRRLRFLHRQLVRLLGNPNYINMIPCLPPRNSNN